MFSLPGYIGLHWFVIFQKDGLCFGGINFNIDIILFCLFLKKSWIIFEWDIAYQRFRLPIFERHCLPVRVFVSIHLFIQVLDWCHQLYCQANRHTCQRKGGGAAVLHLRGSILYYMCLPLIFCPATHSH